MKIVFLDVDGVIINRASCKAGYKIVDKECIRLLNKLIAETDAAIVLSSCWRVGRTRVECCELLTEWGVKGTVLDRTPHTNYSDKRGDEIQAWLDAYPRDVESFVIIDDDADMKHLLPRLVRTKFEPGLTQEDCDKAKRLLETPCMSAATYPTSAKGAGSV